MEPVIKREVEKLYGRNEEKKIIFENLGKEKDERNEYYNIYFALIRKNEIEEYINYDIKINSLDLSLFSKNRIYSKVVEKEKNILILDLGENETELIIYNNGKLSVYREINIGGKDITAILETMLKKSEEEAEELKRKYGYISKNNIIKEEKEIGAQLSFAYQSIMNKLSRKILNSIDYFKINNRGVGIDKIYVTGGTSQLKGIKEFLENEIENKEVEIYSGKELFKVEGKIENDVLYTNAFGTMMLEKSIIKVEKKEKIEKKDIKGEKKSTYIIVIIMIALIMSIYMYKKIKILYVEKKISEYVNNIEQIEEQIDKYENLTEKNNKMEEKIKWIEAVTDKRTDFIDFFYNLSKMTPTNIFFTDIKYENKKVILKGKSIAKDTFPEIPINNFFKQLESKYKKVKLKEIQKTNMETSSFEMELILVGKAEKDENRLN